MSRTDRWLLPEGIEEILPHDARRLERMRRDVLDLFDTWGYDLVMPPLIEYIESLLTGVAHDLDLQTFKLTDQLTGRLMGLRADITPQAARIDAHYLKRNTPVRLCYVGPVVRTRPGAFAGSREPLQVGAELYGHAGPQSDIEIIQLMLAFLKAAGFTDCYVDLGHVGVFRGLAQAAQFSAEQEADLFDALQRKAAPEVRALLAAWNLPSAMRDMLLALTDLHGGRDVIERARDRLRAAPATVLQALNVLEAVADRLQQAVPNASWHFDLAELQGYHYYTGVVFSAFVPEYGLAVAQGGRYDDIGKAFGRARPAAGFSADMRTLIKLAPPPTAMPRGGIGAAAGSEPDLHEAIAKLRALGERVVIQLDGRDPDCDRELIKQNGAWVVVKKQGA